MDREELWDSPDSGDEEIRRDFSPLFMCSLLFNDIRHSFWRSNDANTRVRTLLWHVYAIEATSFESSVRGVQNRPILLMRSGLSRNSPFDSGFPCVFICRDTAFEMDLSFPPSLYRFCPRLL